MYLVTDLLSRNFTKHLTRVFTLQNACGGYDDRIQTPFSPGSLLLWRVKSQMLF